MGELVAKSTKYKHKIAHGLLLIDKPKEYSSFDVIRDLRRSTGVKKMGHTGTLDPMATGLLVLCLGEGTKLVPYLTVDDKSYEAEVTFGISTDSFDADGEVTDRNQLDELVHLNEDLVRDALAQFLGTQEQIPPAFSAIKVNGERLYEKARRGEKVVVPSRVVTFYELAFLQFFKGDGTLSCLPRVHIRVKCSKGTYIRSLATDLGAKLNVCAHLTSLRRTEAGGFKIEQAVTLDKLNADTLDAHLIPLSQALPQATLLSIDELSVQALRQGKPIKAPQDIATSELGLCGALSANGDLVALLTYERGMLKVLRGFNHQQQSG
jgi:tRNA pseudouridine55 synthase